MKQSAHLKITTASAQSKITLARQLSQKQQYLQSIKLYTKGIFLKQDPTYLTELAQIYQSILDLSTALNLHKRAQQLRSVQNQKIRTLALTKGFNLMDSGSMKNILFDCEYTEFRRAYPGFRERLRAMAEEEEEIGEILMNCLGFLETDYRVFAMEELIKCLGKRPKQVELVVLHALIKWSLCRMAEGYKLFWQAYEIAPEDPMVVLFLRLTTPKVEAMYKQTQYLLIDNKTQKCLLNIRKALQLHPHHTNFLIVKAYIHRTRQQYQAALCDLQLANKTLKDTTLQPQLRNQIALTYNQMGSFLFKKKKFTEAIALFNQGITFKPKDWGMRANRGDCYKALNDYTKALEDYLLAYSLSGDVQEMNFRLGTIYNSRGIANFNNKNPRQAVIEFSQAIKYCKNHSQFYLNRAKSLIQLSKIPQAVSDFQQALKYDPNNTEAQKYLLQYKPQQIKPPRRKP